MGLSNIDPESLHLIMAGSGDPWSALTPLRKKMLRALHSVHSTPRLAGSLGLTVEEVEAELRPLKDSSLVHELEDSFYPGFLVVDADEVTRVNETSRVCGERLAAWLMDHWGETERRFQSLDASASSNLRELGFMLVGSRLLDVGLLDRLSSDTRLLKPPPSRPSPSKPNARYYFWMIEGAYDNLGRYGQNDISLPYPDWCLLTFGQYRVNGDRNAARRHFEENTRKLSDEVDDPYELARRTRVHLFDLIDVERWTGFVDSCAQSLVEVYYEREDDLRGLFSSLRASTYNPEGFTEFFCWYHHVAYAWAIDYLADGDYLNIPTQRCQAALWHTAPRSKSFV